MKPDELRRLRVDFPILQKTVHDRPLVYLDNAATTQKPQAVIDAQSEYYRSCNSNVHRGIHALSLLATRAFEAAREKVRRMINAASAEEIVFVRGTTEAINLVAQSYGRERFGAGDEIVISAMEHHSNIVPWQMVCRQTGARLCVIPVDDSGEIALDELGMLLNKNTRMLAITHVSNALGTINPVGKIVEFAHRRGIPVLIDGAQAIAHLRVDVRALDCDFYAFSGHKLYGPTGIGVLYGKKALLDSMPPWQGGGEMIRTVDFEGTTYNSLPYKFEAGTPDIAGAIGLGAAIDYLDGIGIDALASQEAALTSYATRRLAEIPGLRIVGTARDKSGILSFVLQGVHPHDIGTILDSCGVAIRTGHHCTMPLMKRMGLDATARASFALYNTHEEVDALIAAIHRVKEIFDK